MAKFVILVFLVVCAMTAKGDPEEMTDEDMDKAHEAMYGGGNFGGDMMLNAAQKSALKSRNAYPNFAARWPNGIIPYAVDNSIGGLRNLIAQAAAHISNRTGGCVKFVPRTNQRDYVWMIYGNKGCWSWIGRQGGAQELHLGDGCGWFGLAVHEMLHAAGFAHEQNRPDRDQYLTIFWQNIPENQKYNFEVLRNGIVYTGFDYNSIMLYGEYAFTARRGFKTMEDKTRRYTLTEPYQKPNGMTDWDVTNVKRYYNCQ